MQPLFLGFRPFNWKILVKSINQTVWSPKAKAAWTFMNVVIWQKKYIYRLYIFFLPSNRSQIAIRTPLSKARASAAVWKVRPNFLLSVLQWWNVGITRLYSKSLLMVQFKTIWKKKYFFHEIFAFWLDNTKGKKSTWSP